MRIRKLLIGFSKLSDAALLAFALAVLAAMTGNPYFLTPQPTLAALGTGITDFQDAMAAAADGGKNLIIIRRAKRAALVALLKQLATYISLVSDGDEEKMSSTGFALSGEPGPVGPLPKPVNFQVNPGEKGQLKLSLDAIYGAKLYRFGYRLVTETAWTEEDSTASKLLLTGLESGKEYVCRVLPVGTSKVRTYSSEENCFVV